MLLLALAATALTAGNPAPPLGVDRYVQVPAEASTRAPTLRGTATVIEFWDTWCAPCVERIPQWNALVERFAGQPVQFIAIAAEEEEAVRAFLARRPMAGWIGIDSQGSVFKAYGIEFVPQTVLVDAKGIVRAITSPAQLTDGSVETLIAGGDPRLSAPAAPG